MAKKKHTDPKAETTARIQRTEAYAERVRLMFTATVNQILALNRTLPKLEPGVMFSFDGQSLKKQQEVERLLRQLHSVATMAIQQGITLEWGQANAAADTLVKSMFGKEVLSSPQFSAWNNRNGAAMNAFLKRSENGLNLSERVWKAVQQLRDEMEVAITVSVGEGESAQKLSQSVRKYLNDPDLMFRRFRYKAGEEPEYDEDGNEIGKKIIWGRKWKKRIRKPDGTYGWIDYDRDSYKTGAGVYKSSAKNAMRVARTETNIAYRRADHERWQSLDFVLGQRVSMSKDHPKKDICDKLAGDYPKDFVFDGWHPQCFCIVTPITLPPEETAHLTEMFLNGEDWRSELARLRRGREITTYPDNFKAWVTDNAANIQASRERGTEPYFIRNNAQAIDNIINPPKALTPQEIAAQRHTARTPEQEEKIRLAWQERKERIEAEKKASHIAKITHSYGNRILDIMGDIPGVDTTALRGAIKAGDTNLIREEAQKLRALGKQFKAEAHSALGIAAEYGEVSGDALKAAINAGNIKSIWEQTKALQSQIKATQADEAALEALIPNAHELHKEYTLKEMREAYKEIDGVMQKWLAKYKYSSIDSTPLLHLKNKLDFELTSPTISYSQREIVEKAIMAKMRIVEQKIEWENLLDRASVLRTFTTKSTSFKSCLADIDLAITSGDLNTLKASIAKAEQLQQKLTLRRAKLGGDTKTALNPEYKGSAVGSDITSSVDVRKMTSEDPYNSSSFTNNIARQQGFDNPAKLVTASEFDTLEKACGEVFFRTVNETKFRGKSMTSVEFASQLYVADKLELNGPGGRAYGDGMYVATSAWNGRKVIKITKTSRQEAYNESRCYGNRNATISEMTFTRPPKTITQIDLGVMWNKLSSTQKEKFGHNMNTFGCALGYDAMYCDGPNYMVIWNRSIIAVKKQ